MTYNILLGGNLVQGDRTELILNAIKQEDPDILGLCECTGFEEESQRRFLFFLDTLGMKGFINTATSGHHVAILYKPDIPILYHHYNSATMYNGYTQIRIASKEINAINIIMSHLHPYSSLSRSAEAQILIGRASSSPEAIIMGDMNTVAPSELPLDLSNASPTLITRLRGIHTDIDTQAIEIIHSQNFQDLARNIKCGTYPTPLTGSRENSPKLIRLDYIFSTERVADLCKNIEIINNKHTQLASDHLPVIADFNLSW